MLSDKGCNRRAFLIQAAASLLLAGCHLGKSRQSPDTASSSWNGDPEAAVSLRAFQAQVGEGHFWSTSANEAIPALNQVTGFILDGSDVILFGRQNAAAPSIDFDSFAVALRNAHGAGDAYHGDPGCSIDPIPGDDPFRVQKVSVFGVPNDCTMAARHVALDYELKRAGAGIQGEDGKLLPSLFELENRDGPCAGEQSRSVSMAHRFWYFPLTPESPRFERDSQTISIARPVSVQLLTEQEFLNTRGERTGATEAGPVARQFADAVTALLNGGHVARFMQIVADFRLIELARLMRYCGVSQDQLQYLLWNHKLQTASVPSFVGGVERDEQGRTVCKSTVTQTNTAIQSVQDMREYHFEYRGGVEASVKVESGDFASKDLSSLRRKVLDARSSETEVSWRVA